MPEPSRTGASLVLAALLAAAPGSAPQRPTVAQSATPIGVWDLKGSDAAKTTWIGTLVLVRAEKGTMTGHIDWLGSNGSSGRERVTATFDEGARILAMQGTRIEQSQTIVPGNYIAALAPEGALLTNGRWSAAGGVVPGSWSAVRINLAATWSVP